MRALIHRESLLEAVGMVASVIPARSPRAILQNAKLTTTPDGSTLSGTDLEAGIRRTVSGVKPDDFGSVILNPSKLQSILRTSRDEELSIETDGDTVRIAGLHAEFHLPSEDPDLFPEVPAFTATAYHVVAAADYKRAIRRTLYATDVESTRYALGGVLHEPGDDSLSLVGTDGRRLSKQVVAAEREGEPVVAGSLVVPVKALKLIDRNLDESDPPVHIAFTNTNATIRMDRATIYTRLVEGRYPRYQDVIPATSTARIPIQVGALLSAVEQASILTSEESRGCDFSFGNGLLRLSSQAADVGKSKVETPIGYEGATLEATFDPRYLSDMLKTLDPASEITVGIVDHKNAVAFTSVDGFIGIVMPLTRDR